jgi:hypothetical protein
MKASDFHASASGTTTGSGGGGAEARSRVEGGMEDEGTGGSAYAEVRRASLRGLRQRHVLLIWAPQSQKKLL